MGKKRANNGKRKQPTGAKRPRWERYWVEDCRETPGSIPSDAALTLWITRVELTDDHTHGPKAASTVESAVQEATDEAKTDGTVETGDSEALESKGEDPQQPEKVPKSSRESQGSTPHNPDEALLIKSPPPQSDPVMHHDKSNDDRGVMDDPKEVQRHEQEEANHNEGNANKDSVQAECPKIEKKQSDGLGNQMIYIRRDQSAKKTPKKFPRHDFRPLPKGDCGDGIQNPFPHHVVDDKYWAQRHRLFSRFDQGIKLDRESWYSVTPEAIAVHIARKMIQEAAIPANEGLVVLDTFCGAGGNAIAFARQPEVALVVCVDLDEEKLRLAAHNSRVYGVPDDKILFLHEDACNVLQQYRHGKLVKEGPTDAKDSALLDGYKLGGLDLLPATIGAVFLSPPWGGSDYESIGRRKYNLKCIRLGGDSDGEQLLKHAALAVPLRRKGSIACFLPRNTNGLDVARSALQSGISGSLEMEQNFLNQKLKAVTIYMGSCKELGSTVTEEVTAEIL